jgi:threonine/homoserine/homoserine lactone efflux protein
MLSVILVGVSYALSAGLQPGPLQAFFLAKVTQVGWKRALPAAMAPLISDGPIAIIAILFLNILPVSFRDYLQLAGGIILLVFAWIAFQNWQNKEGEKSDFDPPSSTPETLFKAALINLLNPNPYLGWSLVMGPAVLSAWAQSPGLAIALLLAFYITMISTSMVMIYLMGQALLLGPKAGQTLSLVSALILVGLGLYFLYSAGTNLLKIN